MHLKACHQRTGKGIAGQVEIARTFLKRLIGLMGRSILMEDQGLYFPGCKSIHTFGMKFAIDVLFMDKNMKITKMISCLKPNRVAFAPFSTRDTLELACGVLQKHALAVGDEIALIQIKHEGCNDGNE
jgi:uncharacterized membrane protein (UPF0127 family)